MYNNESISAKSYRKSWIFEILITQRVKLRDFIMQPPGEGEVSGDSDRSLADTHMIIVSRNA